MPLFKKVSLPPALPMAAIAELIMIVPLALDVNVNAPAPPSVQKSSKSLPPMAASPTPSAKAPPATRLPVQRPTVVLPAPPVAQSQSSTGWVNALAIKFTLIKFNGFIDSLFLILRNE